MAKFPFYLIRLLSFCCIFSNSESFEFVYNGFNETTNLVRDGSATIKSSYKALKLTDRSPNVIGHAFYPYPIPMFNNSPNASSFSTHFVFQIVSSDVSRGGYGFAFLLSPSRQLPGAEGGHLLGVVGRSNDGNSTNHLFIVEFDTVDGYHEESDGHGNHIGININGMKSKVQQAAQYDEDGTGKMEDLDLEGKDPIQAWIDYDGLTKVVNVTISPLRISKPTIPLLSRHLDLSPVMKNDMYAGFSAATGEKSSSHYILGWSFKLNGFADPLDISQFSAIPTEKSSSFYKKLRKALIITSSVVLFVLLVTLSFFMYRKVMQVEILEDWERDCPHRFRYKDLYVATKGFKQSEVIGVGGFGTVYKGVLQTTGVEVAVKKIKEQGNLQGTREFAAEIESLGRLRHKNLVNLQGWCKKKGNLLLVYDYVPNGSLYSLLYSPMNGNVLTWEQRFNIVKGVASGLLYLHEEWEKVVIHRDVKSSNILIDHDMNVRLGDFGLARLYDHGQVSHTTKVVGTIGYIAPELTQTGKASTSTDVFAFGILILEIACGRAPVAYEPENNVILVDRILDRLQMGNILDAVDPKLNASYSVEEVELVLGLGLLCSHRRPEARPTMRQVIRYLNKDEILPVFDKLYSFGSKSSSEIRSRISALGLSDDSILTSSIYSTTVGEMSSGSFDTGR